jgi:tetratricopeptide (TPR) repeat protein
MALAYKKIILITGCSALVSALLAFAGTRAYYTRQMAVFEEAPSSRSAAGEAVFPAADTVYDAEVVRLEAEVPAEDILVVRLETEARTAEDRAAAEAQAARRRAQEEDLAQKSRELRAEMRGVEDLVAKGRNALGRDDFAVAAAAFAEARSAMPAGEGGFEAEKLADIAEAYFEAYARNPGSAEGAAALKEAAAYARSAVEKDPARALPHHTLGKVYRELGQLDSALIELNEAVRLDGQNYVYAFDQGRVLFLLKKYREALDSFERVTRLKTNFESGWYNLGGVYRVLGRPEDALAACRRAVGIRPEYAAAHREIGRILSAMGDNNGAAAAFSRALQYAPDDAASLRELGTAQSAAGNYAAAEISFNRALSGAAGDARTNYNMAVVKLALQKNAEAVNYARKAAEQDGANSVYAYTLGLAKEAEGDVDGAAGAYARAISLDSAYVRPRINLGSLCLFNGYPDEALSLLQEAYLREPGSFEVNNNMGAAYAQKEQWRESVGHYERALAVEPDNQTVRLNLARALVRSGELVRAREAYQELLRISADNEDARFELGQIFVSLGDNHSARQSLQELLRRNPKYTGKAEVERILAGL